MGDFMGSTFQRGLTQSASSFGLSPFLSEIELWSLERLWLICKCGDTLRLEDVLRIVEEKIRGWDTDDIIKPPHHPGNVFLFIYLFTYFTFENR